MFITNNGWFSVSKIVEVSGIRFAKTDREGEVLVIDLHGEPSGILRAPDGEDLDIQTISWLARRASRELGILGEVNVTITPCYPKAVSDANPNCDFTIVGDWNSVTWKTLTNRIDYIEVSFISDEQYRR